MAQPTTPLKNRLPNNATPVFVFLQVRPQGLAVPANHRRGVRVRLRTARGRAKPRHRPFLQALQHHRVSGVDGRYALFFISEYILCTRYILCLYIMSVYCVTLYVYSFVLRWQRWQITYAVFPSRGAS